MRCTELQIAERGMVDGLVVADKVIVLGEFVGAIYANEIVLGAACAVEGHIFHRKLVLEEGCYFEGKSRCYCEPDCACARRRAGALERRGADRLLVKPARLRPSSSRIALAAALR